MVMLTVLFFREFALTKKKTKLLCGFVAKNIQIKRRRLK